MIFASGLDDEAGLRRFGAVQRSASGNPTLSTTIARTSGGKSLQIDLASSEARVEVFCTDGSWGYQCGSDTYWFGFSTYIPSSPGIAVSSFNILSQWRHIDDGGIFNSSSPPIALCVNSTHISGDGTSFHISGCENATGGTTPWRQRISDTIYDAWTDWVFRITFGVGAGNGSVDVYQNAVKVIDNYQPPDGIGFPTTQKQCAWRVGLYRNAVASAARVHFDNLRVGRSFDEVDPSRPVI